MRMAGIAFASLAVISSAACGGTGEKTYACLTTLTTLHQDEKPSFQDKPPAAESIFVLKTHPTRHPDSLWCMTETRPTGLRQAYCALPFQADVEGESYYGEDTKNFRGYFVWDYFVLFDDDHFLWSAGTNDGVIIRSGACKAS